MLAALWKGLALTCQEVWGKDTVTASFRFRSAYNSRSFEKSCGEKGFEREKFVAILHRHQRYSTNTDCLRDNGAVLHVAWWIICRVDGNDFHLPKIPCWVHRLLSSAAVVSRSRTSIEKKRLLSQERERVQYDSLHC